MAATTLTYRYSVRDRDGKLVKGKLEGESPHAVVTKLKAMGYAPISVAANRSGGLNKEVSFGAEEGHHQGAGRHVPAVRHDDRRGALPAAVPVDSGRADP